METTNKDKDHLQILAWALCNRPHAWKDVIDTFVTGFRLESDESWAIINIIRKAFDKLNLKTREELQVLAETLQEDGSLPAMVAAGQFISSGFVRVIKEHTCDKCGGRGIVENK